MNQKSTKLDAAIINAFFGAYIRDPFGGRRESLPTQCSSVTERTNRQGPLRKAERNKTIYLSRVSGDTFAAIAKRHNISIGRVDQIVQDQARRQSGQQ